MKRQEFTQEVDDGHAETTYVGDCRISYTFCSKIKRCLKFIARPVNLPV